MKLNIQLPREEEVIKYFNEACQRLEIDGSRENLERLVIYDMTDGSRTSTNLYGSQAYIDGAMFVLRFLHILKILGAKNAYINVIEEKHKERVNYEEIYNALRALPPIYEKYSKSNNIRLKFLGDYKYRIEPLKILKGVLKKAMRKRGKFKLGKINFDADSLRKYLRNLEKKAKEEYGYDMRKSIKNLEKQTSRNNGMNVYVLVNYSTKWAAKNLKKKFISQLPEINAVIRHTKGYIGGDMWIYDKFDKNTLVYAQNGSSSVNWSDRQLVYLIASALRSFLVNRGGHQSKAYIPGENELIKKKREHELAMIHKNFYDKRVEKKLPKRVVIFGFIGPEIYEF